MEIPSGVSVLIDRVALNRQNEDRFWQWVNPNEDEEVFSVFDTALSVLNVLQRLAEYQDLNANVEIIDAFERIVSHSYAVLAMFEKGFLAEGHSILRIIGEGRNILLLLAKNETELQSYLLANENQRNNKFSAAKVRGKLEEMGIDPYMGGKLYSRVSRKFSHFSTGSTALNNNAYQLEPRRLDYHRLNLILSVLAWAWSIHIVLRIAVEFLENLRIDPAITRLVYESHKANDTLETRLKARTSPI